MSKVGEKVVCIDDNYHPETLKRVFCRPVKNEIYTILDVVLKLQTGEIGYILKEVRNALVLRDDTEYFFEPNWNSKRFVPVQTVDDLVEIEKVELINV